MISDIQNIESALGKPVLFALYKEERLPAAVYTHLTRIFREIDYKGSAHIFANTTYYAGEFGDKLYRHVISFSGLVSPEELPTLKHLMYNIELEYSENEKRTLNLDIGYLDTDKLVLASFKRGRNKLYMGRNVYADMLMEYAKGNFSAMPWAFEDFRSGTYNKELIVIREKLKSSMKKSNT